MQMEKNRRGYAEQRDRGLTTYGHNLGLSLRNARRDRPEVQIDLLHTSQDGDSVRFDVLEGRSRIGWRNAVEHASGGWGIYRQECTGNCGSAVVRPARPVGCETCTTNDLHMTAHGPPSSFSKILQFL